MEEISEAERKAVIVFRKKVEDVLPNEYTRSDEFLIRWLRARDSNQRLAEEMLRNHLSWRREQDIERVLESPPDPYFTKNYPCDIDGVALDGGPVFCMSMKYWDVRKLVSDNKVPLFQNYINFACEKLDAKIRRFNESRRPGQKPAGFTVIVNFEGFSILQLTSIKGIQAFLCGFSTYEAHYPEILAKAFFVGTNYVFQYLFVLIKPLLAPKTLSKIAVYGNNRSEWEPAVRALVHGNQIPYECGGVGG